MNSRRFVLGLGAAAAGLTAAAFLQTAVAFAAPTTVDTDPFGFAPVAGGSENTATFLGIPPLYEQNIGFGDFDYYLTPSGGTQTLQGSVEGQTSTFEAGASTGSSTATSSTALFQNEEFIVNYSNPVPISGTGSSEVLGTVPGVGSVYDITSFAGYTNDYSDVVTTSSTGTATQVVTDDLYTPFSSTPIDLSSLLSGFEFAGISQDISSLF